MKKGLLSLTFFVFCAQAHAQQAPGNADCAMAFNNETCVISNDYVNSCSGTAPAGKQCVVHDFHNGTDKCYCWESKTQFVQECSDDGSENDENCVYMID